MGGSEIESFFPAPFSFLYCFFKGACLARGVDKMTFLSDITQLLIVLVVCTTKEIREENLFGNSSARM